MIKIQFISKATTAPQKVVHESGVCPRRYWHKKDDEIMNTKIVTTAPLLSGALGQSLRIGERIQAIR